MGPSGSGKSTFMNLLGCLDTPSAGPVRPRRRSTSRTCGRTRSPAIRNEKIGFVFQTFNLLPRTTALENVELPLLYSGGPGHATGRPRARAKLAAVGLADRERPSPDPALGRPAAARGHRARPRQRPGPDPGRRADRARSTRRTSVEIMALFQDLNRDGHHRRARHPRARHRPLRRARPALPRRPAASGTSRSADRLDARELLATLPRGDARTRRTWSRGRLDVNVLASARSRSGPSASTSCAAR